MKVGYCPTCGKERPSDSVSLYCPGGCRPVTPEPSITSLIRAVGDIGRALAEERRAYVAQAEVEASSEIMRKCIVVGDELGAHVAEIGGTAAIIDIVCEYEKRAFYRKFPPAIPADNHPHTEHRMDSVTKKDVIPATLPAACSMVDQLNGRLFHQIHKLGAVLRDSVGPCETLEVLDKILNAPENGANPGQELPTVERLHAGLRLLSYRLDALEVLPVHFQQILVSPSPTGGSLHGAIDGDNQDFTKRQKFNR